MIPAGTLDVHVHAGPSVFERKHDALELASAVASSDVNGVVLKSHFGSTAPLARLAASRTPGVEVYPSVTLNTFVGGFEPAAVEAAVKAGARTVWLPTFSAAAFDPGDVGVRFPVSHGSLTVFDDGDVRDDVREVLAVAADADPSPAVASGHLSREETFAVLDVVKEAGLDLPYVVTHPDFAFSGLSFEDQRDLANRGAVLEKCYLPVVAGDVTVEAVAEHLETLGGERCVLSTDHGQPSNRSPPEAYERFGALLRDVGVPKRTLERAAAEIPRRVLGLSR